MIARYLFHAKSLESFFNTYFEKMEVTRMDWKIYSGTSEERYERIKKKSYRERIEFFFNDKYDMDVSKYSLISYFDTLSLLQRVKEQLSQKNVSNIEVYMEFEIPYSFGRRIDYLLVFKNTIVLLEFEKIQENTWASDIKKKYEKKHAQVMQYNSLLSAYITSKTKTVPITILYYPEYQDDKGFVEKYQKKNNQNLNSLVDLIEDLYKKDSTASEEIESLLSKEDLTIVDES